MIGDLLLGLLIGYAISFIILGLWITLVERKPWRRVDGGGDDAEV